MRSTDHIPKPCRRPDGRGVVRLNGKDHYLGRAGDWPKAKQSPPPTIQAEYQMLVSRWLANGRNLPTGGDDPTVNDVLLAYDKYAEVYYHRDERENTHLVMIRHAARIVKDSFGRTPAREFGPKKLKQVQQAMVQKGWSRNYVNAQTDRVRLAFKWAVAEELVPLDLYHGLQAVPGLRKNTKGVRETEPIGPVSEAAIDTALPFMPEVIRAMVRVQLLTGARPGEVCVMRACDIDRSEDIWVYRPHRHKTEHLGKDRRIFVGPQAQRVLQPWLVLPETTTDYLFSPAASEAARSAERRRNRRSPMTPSQAARKKAARPTRPIGGQYDARSYRLAVYRACDRAFPPPAPLARLRGESETQRTERLSAPQREELARWRSGHRWHPNQIRHTAATLIRKELGIEAARIVLGHSHVKTTEIYAESNQRIAAEAMTQLG